jgi:thiol-disulfide isomerase/thioredoxin
MKLKICLMGLLCLFFTASAHPINKVKPLKIGDQVPDILVANLLNYSDGSLKLNAFKNKILILDFWATWCSSCIRNFPKMYALQKEMPEQLQILLVNCKSTRDNEEKIKAFFDKRKAFYQFPVAFNDTMLEALFPHHTIPHYVWIKNNTVIAITDASELSESNIRKMLKGDGALHEKNYIKFDNRHLLFLDGNGGTSPSILFRSTLPAYKDGLQNFAGFAFNDEERVTRIDVLNAPRILLVKFAYPEFAATGSDRIILKVLDPTIFSADSSSMKWRVANCFSYEALFSARSRARALVLMQADIQRFLSVRIDTVSLEADCMVLSVADSSKIVKPPKGVHPESNINDETGAPVYFTNYSLSIVLHRLEDLYRIPFINDGPKFQQVTLQLPGKLTDEQALKDSLKEQGFSLVHARRTIKYLVISDEDKGASATQSKSNY